MAKPSQEKHVLKLHTLPLSVPPIVGTRHNSNEMQGFCWQNQSFVKQFYHLKKVKTKVNSDRELLVNYDHLFV